MYTKAQQISTDNTPTTPNNISTTTQVAQQPHRTINGMDFVSVQNETKRYYDVPVFKADGTPVKGVTVRVVIEAPQWLFVRPSGSHLVVDSAGETHYIPANFVHLAWLKKEGTDAAEF